MSLRAEHPNPMRLHGSHATPGRDGTVLSFDVFITTWAPGEVSAKLDVSTYVRPANPDRTEVSATSTDARSAIRKLASYLRRCADALDEGAGSVLLPEPESSGPCAKLIDPAEPGEAEE